MDVSNLYGRLFTAKQVPNSTIIQLNLTGQKAISLKGKYAICHRCHFKNLKKKRKIA